MKYEKPKVTIDLDEYETLIKENKELREVFKSKNPIVIHRNYVYYGMGGSMYDYTIYTKDEAVLQLTQSFNKLSADYNEEVSKRYELQKELNKKKSFW